GGGVIACGVFRRGVLGCRAVFRRRVIARGRVAGGGSSLAARRSPDAAQARVALEAQADVLEGFAVDRDGRADPVLVSALGVGVEHRLVVIVVELDRDGVHVVGVEEGRGALGGGRRLPCGGASGRNEGDGRETGGHGGRS